MKDTQLFSGHGGSIAFTNSQDQAAHNSSMTRGWALEAPPLWEELVIDGTGNRRIMLLWEFCCWSVLI